MLLHLTMNREALGRTQNKPRTLGVIQVAALAAVSHAAAAAFCVNR
jgi:hypothetical protein